MVAVHGPDHLAECRPQGWGERDRKRLDHGDLQTASAAGGGDLEADEPGSYDGDTGRAFAVPTAARSRRPPRKTSRPARGAMPGRSDACARCDDQSVVVGERATGKHDSSGAELDRHRAHAKTHVESERIIAVLPAEEGLFGLPGP